MTDTVVDLLIQIVLYFGDIQRIVFFENDELLLQHGLNYLEAVGDIFQSTILTTLTMYTVSHALLLPNIYIDPNCFPEETIIRRPCGSMILLL